MTLHFPATYALPGRPSKTACGADVTVSTWVCEYPEHWLHSSSKCAACEAAVAEKLAVWVAVAAVVKLVMGVKYNADMAALKVSHENYMRARVAA